MEENEVLGTGNSLEGTGDTEDVGGGQRGVYYWKTTTALRFKVNCTSLSRRA